MTTTAGEARGPDPAAQDRAIPADTFASRLMLVRVHAGYITIKEAAERCGLNYGSWSNWERGSRPLDKDEVVEAISEALNIDRDWLQRGGPLAKPEPTRRRNDRTFTYRRNRKPIPRTPRTGHVESSASTMPPRPVAKTHRPGGRSDRAATAPPVRRATIKPRRLDA